MARCQPALPICGDRWRMRDRALALATVFGACCAQDINPYLAGRQSLSRKFELVPVGPLVFEVEAGSLGGLYSEGLAALFIGP
jgi:hypothetical protein